MLDRLRIKSGSSLELASPSSLSALAIDGSHVTQQSPLPLGYPPHSSGPVPAPQSRSKVWWIAAGAVVCGGVLGLTLAGGPATSPVSSAGGSVPPSEFVAVDPATHSVAAASASAAVPSPAASLAAEASEATEQQNPQQPAALAQKKSLRRVVRVAPVGPKQAAKVPAAPGESAAPGAPAAEPPRPREPAKQKTNAWDPNSFGARQ